MSLISLIAAAEDKTLALHAAHVAMDGATATDIQAQDSLEAARAHLRAAQEQEAQRAREAAAASAALEDARNAHRLCAEGVAEALQAAAKAAGKTAEEIRTLVDARVEGLRAMGLLSIAGPASGLISTAEQAPDHPVAGSVCAPEPAKDADRAEDMLMGIPSLVDALEPWDAGQAKELQTDAPADGAPTDGTPTDGAPSADDTHSKVPLPEGTPSAGVENVVSVASGSKGAQSEDTAIQGSPKDKPAGDADAKLEDIGRILAEAQPARETIAPAAAKGKGWGAARPSFGAKPSGR